LRKKEIPVDPYDQGSTTRETILAKNNIMKPADKVVKAWVDAFSNTYDQFLNLYAASSSTLSLVTFLLTIAFPITTILWSLYIRRRRTSSPAVVNMKKIMAARLIIRQDKKNLTLFDDLRTELNEEFLKGKINNRHYQLLSDKISEYKDKIDKENLSTNSPET